MDHERESRSIDGHARTPGKPHDIENLFRTAVEAAPIAMLLIAQDGCIAVANHQAELLFGYRREEFTGMHVERLIPPRFRTPHATLLASFFERPEPRPMGAGRDFPALRKDGSEVLVEIGLGPVAARAGGFVVASIIDSTHRKRAVDVLQRIAEELEHRIAERTRELMEETGKRRQVQKELADEHELTAAVLAAAAALTVVRDCEGRIVRFNKACETATRLTFREAENRPAWEEAEALCERFAMLEEGRVVALDTTQNPPGMRSGCYVELRLEPDRLPERLVPKVVEKRANGVCRLALRDYGDLEELMRELRTSGVRVHELEVMRPDLEEVFVQITQKS